MKNKTRIKNSKKGYGDWLSVVGGNDPESLDDMWEGHSPFAITPTSPVMDDAYEKLEDLYYGGQIKGRQREIVSLLMDGVFNETEIARRIGVEVTTVRTQLRRLRKKLLE